MKTFEHLWGELQDKLYDGYGILPNFDEWSGDRAIIPVEPNDAALLMCEGRKDIVDGMQEIADLWEDFLRTDHPMDKEYRARIMSDLRERVTDLMQKV